MEKHQSLQTRDWNCDTLTGRQNRATINAWKHQTSLTAFVRYCVRNMELVCFHHNMDPKSTSSLLTDAMLDARTNKQTNKRATTTQNTCSCIWTFSEQKVNLSTCSSGRENAWSSLFSDELVWNAPAASAHQLTGGETNKNLQNDI